MKKTSAILRSATLLSAALSIAGPAAAVDPFPENSSPVGTQSCRVMRQ